MCQIKWSDQAVGSAVTVIVVVTGSALIVDVTLIVAYVVYTVVNGQVVTPVDVTLKVVQETPVAGRLLKLQ